MQLEMWGCPACKKRISAAALSCPSCGHPLETGWAEAEAEKARRAKGIGCLTMIAAVALFTLIGLNLERDQQLHVAAAEYGDQWGFVPTSVIVRCDRHAYTGGVRRPHVLVEANGKTFALNGAARSSGLYLDARDIMQKDEQGLFTFRGPNEVLQRGLELCN